MKTIYGVNFNTNNKKYPEVLAYSAIIWLDSIIATIEFPSKDDRDLFVDSHSDIAQSTTDMMFPYVDDDFDSWRPLKGCAVHFIDWDTLRKVEDEASICNYINKLQIILNN